jgi:hypothetical protein
MTQQLEEIQSLKKTRTKLFRWQTSKVEVAGDD